MYTPRNHGVIEVLVFALLIVSSTWGASRSALILHVSPDGDDLQAGTAVAPLRSLTGARDRVRIAKQEGRPVTVRFAAGTYPFAQPVLFGKEDTGTARQPIIYAAEPNAAVRFTGGVTVRGWQTVTDRSVLRQLAPDARSHLRVADLRALGITDYGALAVRGFGKGSPLSEAEVFFDDKPMTLSRWPNMGFRGVAQKHSDQRIEVDTDRPQRWTQESDPWIFAYWHHDWAELYEPVTGIETGSNVLQRSPEIKPQYGITPSRARWYALNLLSELDRPGEYYLDRKAGLLYFWPPARTGETVLSMSPGIMQTDELSHVTFQGFTLEACRGTAIRIKRGSTCAVVACTIRNTGQRGVIVDGGDHHTVYGCDIYETGEGGLSMNGGDRPTLRPAQHNAENNHVHHYSRRARTYKSAIAVSGVGNRIAHNLVHDGPHMALSAGGNDHVVEYNEIHNVVYESGDAGAFYVGRDWTQRGTVLRYNYWHQIVGATGHGGMTIYLDDQHSGHTIHGNLFERCSRAVFIGGGDDNIVTNNVFIDCWRAAHVDNRGMGWQKQATDDPQGTLRKNLRAMPYKNELWSQRYPTLPGILDDQPNIPKRNVFRANVSAGGTWDDIHQGTRSYQSVEMNFVFDADPDWIVLKKDAWQRPRTLRFEDPDTVANLGFKPLPLEKMGLYQDARRASWPAIHEVRVVELPGIPKRFRFND